MQMPFFFTHQLSNRLKIDYKKWLTYTDKLV